MNKRECLTFDEIILLIDGKVNGKQAAKLKKHTDSCSSCAEEFSLIRAMLNRKNARSSTSPKSEQTIPDTFYDMQASYFQGTLQDDELNLFYRHLGDNPACFTEFYSTISDAVRKISKEDKVIAKTIRSVAVEDRLSQYKKRFITSTKEEKAEKSVWLTAGKLAAAACFLVVGFLALDFGTNRLAVINATDEYIDALAKYEVALGEARPSGAENAVYAGEQKAAGAVETYSDENLTKAVLIDPENAKFHHQLGAVYFFEGKFTEAQIEYMKALSFDESNPRIYNDLALVQIETNDLYTAKSYLEQALKLDPSFHEANYNMAIVLQLLNQPEAAIAAWNHYLELDTDPASRWRENAFDSITELEDNLKKDTPGAKIE